MFPARLNFNGEATRKLRGEYSRISLIVFVRFPAKNETKIGVFSIDKLH